MQQYLDTTDKRAGLGVKSKKSRNICIRSRAVETDVRNASGLFNAIYEVTGFRKASYTINLPSCADKVNEARSKHFHTPKGLQ